jgi:hypothetical protein
MTDIPKLLKVNYLKIAILFIVAIYLLCALDFYQVVANDKINWFVNDHMLTNAEDSFFELLSAVAWFSAMLLFLWLFKKSMNKSGFGATSKWFLFFTLLCAVAFGEEISWGSHLFNYSRDLYLMQINVQKEVNLHNINFARTLGAERGDVLYPYTRNIGRILTPMFYLVLAFFWVFLPLIKTKLGKVALFEAMPVPSSGFIGFYVIHGVVFILIDVIFFNVGQVFEMFISLAAIIVALDMLKWLSAQHHAGAPRTQ